MSETSSPPRPTFAPAVPPSERPLSPHLQVWRWTVTMASSIAQRATGIALYAGSVVLTAWIVSAALGEAAYTTFQAIMWSPIGVLALIGFTWAQAYHMSKGILHLIWDSGSLIKKEEASKATIAVFIISFVLTALVWIVAISMAG